jgi:hypothetical protein
MHENGQPRLPSCPWCGIDAHAHFFPEEWIRLLVREGPANGATVTTDEHGLRARSCPSSSASRAT